MLILKINTRYYFLLRNAIACIIILLFMISCNQQAKESPATMIKQDTVQTTIAKLDSLFIRDTVTKMDTLYIRDTVVTTETALPEIKVPVLSASNNILYQYCQNTLSFDVPESFGNPRVTASNAEVLPSKSDKRKYAIIPSGSTCIITLAEVKEGRTTDFKSTYNYKIYKAPKPGIDLIVNGKSLENPVPVPKTSRITIRIKPDNDFMAGFPRDARYEISKIDVLMQASLGPPVLVNSITGSGKDATKGIAVSLGTQVRQARPGTIIFVRIEDVYRVNFKGQKIKVDLSPTEKLFSLVVK